MRGISILLVFFFHLNLTLFGNGFLGVDIFFVISGFLMAKVYGDIATVPEIKAYLAKRFSRLLPAYFFVLLATLAISVIIVLPHELATINRHGIWSAFLAPNIGFWMDNSYFDSSQLKPLLNFWSLGVEIQFYFIFPFLLWVFRKSKVSVLVLTFLSMAAFFAIHKISPKTAFFFMPTRVWEFMVGFFITLAPSPERRFSWLGALSLSAIVLLVLFLPDIQKNIVIATIATVIFTALVIYCRIPELIENSRVFATFGKYSYSIYLVHFPVIVLTNYMPFHGTQLAPADSSSLLGIIVLTLVLSFGLYHLVENPLRRKLKGVQVFTGAIAFAALCVVATLVLNHAVQVFVPENKYKISAAFLDRDVYRCGKIKRIAEPFSESCSLTGDDTSEHGFLLVGNSHADAIKFRLTEVIQSKKGSLRLMKQNYSIGNGITPSLVLAEAKKHKISTVILHSSADLINFEAIRDLVMISAEEGINVAYIDPVPTFDYHVPEKLYGTLSEKASFESGTALKDYRKKHEDLSKKIDMLEAGSKNFRRYQVAHLLCTPACQVVDDVGRPLYFDSSHLTLTGAEKLKAVFKTIASH